MDIIRSLPSTMGGLSACCLAIGALILIIFKALVPAVVLATIGGIGAAGRFGELVDSVVSGGSRASSNVTAALFGAAIPAIFFVLLACVVWKYALQGGGGRGAGVAALVGGGKGRGRGRGVAVGGGRRGGRFKTIAKNWALFVSAAALGAVIGTMPGLYRELDRFVRWAHSGLMSLFT